MPPRLRRGDTVAVPAPASPVERDKLAAGLAVLRERYDVRIDEGAYASTGFLAGSDERRIDELNAYLRDPDVRGIFAARGGYGVLRILPHLDADALRADPKVIVGFSDITALLAWSLRCAGVRPIHGPVVTQLGRLGEDDCAWLFRLIESAAPAGEVPGGLDVIGAALSPVDIAGPLVGGNLSLLAHMIGTPYELGFAGAVGFIEDIGERPYAVDRYLTRMHLAGALSGCKGMAVGSFTDCVGRGDVFEVADERLRHAGLSGARGLAVGHGDRNFALPMGARCTLSLSRKTLAIDEPAVG